MQSSSYSKEDLVQKLNLQPHPEGGFYKETYRSESSIPNAVLRVITKVTEVMELEFILC